MIRINDTGSSDKTKSILTSIKKMLGIQEETKHFDPDLIMHINSALMILNQMGLGPTDGFHIIDEKDTWDEFIPENQNMALVKTYVFQKVKLIFDPPLSTAAIGSIEKLNSEFEWRLYIAAQEPIKEQ